MKKEAPQETSTFVFTNPNPKGKRGEDCVIRALSIALGISWDEVFRELMEVAFERKDIPNTKRVYEAYLKSKGWVKHRLHKNAQGKWMRITELDGLYHFESPVIFGTSGHLSCFAEGKVRDTWDCSDRVVGNYFTKGETKNG